MLYVTTRTQEDSFTPLYVLTHDLGPDGGQFLPMMVSPFGEEALQAVAARSFNENIAHILNLLYRRALTGRDLDLAIGKHPLRLTDLNSHTLMAEVWPNPDWRFAELAEHVFRLLVKEPEARPSQWFTMSVRIAMLFGVFGELMARELVTAEKPMDVAMPSDDFQFPMAAWYARQWGLPIGNIVCCCNENNAPWSLLHQGEMRTDQAVRHTMTDACDQAVPAGLERLIAGTLGTGEVERYVRTLEKGRPYGLEPEQLEALRRGIWVSVVSRRRMNFMIPNICPPEERILNPYTVMSYAGLVDHRSQAGETGRALIISEENPVFHVRMLAKAMSISPDALRKRLENL